ncbi:hypothetical protein D3C73_850180 [compost metagenome]
MTDHEKKSLLNFLLVSNFSYAFNKAPIVYEQITQYIADKFHLSKSQIVLIGSAQTGFAIDPDNYGRPFSENSDLDFAIIDKLLFEKSNKDFNLWKTKTENNEYSQEVKNRYWRDNQINLRDQIKRGFLDTYKIPNFIEFETIQPINNSLALIVRYLKTMYKIEVKGASVRIYKDWNTFRKQVRINIESVLKKLETKR